jgi:hypothetical protein
MADDEGLCSDREMERQAGSLRSVRLGELHVRHYHSIGDSASYTIDRLVRLTSPDEWGALSRQHDAGT